MDNKLSELSTPLYLRCVDRGTGETLYTPCGKDYPRGKGYYSQEYVSALLAELEAKDKSIAELEQDELAMRASSRAVHEAQENHINQQQDRIDSLENTNSGLGQRLGAAEKRLATPVQLQNCDFESAAIMAHWCTDEQLKAWVKGVEHAKKQIRTAGFKVEGDE